ncbi:MAG: Ger(x)C family spore germination protein [Bacilli bacterium]
MLSRGALGGYMVSLGLCCGLLSGCYDRAELEEQAFTVILGVDRATGRQVQATARVAVPSKLSGSGGATSGGGDYRSGTSVVAATGRNLNEALLMMNTGIERTINLSHLSGVIFGKSLAREGLLPQFRTLVRYREFRRTLYAFVADASAADIFQSDRPVLESSATRLIEDLHDSSRRTGYAPSVQVHEFMGELETPNEDPVLPILSENRQAAREGGKSSRSARQTRGGRARKDRLPTDAGQINRIGGNPVECVGAAIFRGDRMVCALSGEETRLLQLLTGALKRTTYTIASPTGQKGYLSVHMRDAEPMHVLVKLSGRRPSLRIEQVFEAELVGDQTDASFADAHNRELLETRMARSLSRSETALIKKLYRKYQVDPFRFFRYARGQFSTYDDMMRYDWHRRLPRVAVRVTARVALRRLGTQLDPSVIQ